MGVYGERREERMLLKIARYWFLPMGMQEEMEDGDGVGSTRHFSSTSSPP